MATGTADVVGPRELEAALAGIRSGAAPLAPWFLPDPDAEPQGVWERPADGDQGPLLVPFDPLGEPGMDAAATAVNAVDAADRLVGVLASIAVEHRPVTRWHVRDTGTVVQDACPDCLGGLLVPAGADLDEPRECGCWGRAEVVCASCGQAPEGRAWLVPVPWPCPTWGLLAAVARPAQGVDVVRFAEHVLVEGPNPGA